MLAKNGTTTLIAKDITQGGSVVNNLLTIVNTRVCARSKDAGYAALTTTKGATSTKQIAMGLDGMSCGEHLADEALHTALYLRTNTTAIKIYRIYLGIAQLGQQLVVENGKYLVVGHMKRIETHSVDLYLRGFATWLEAYPIRLCATTISY